MNEILLTINIIAHTVLFFANLYWITRVRYTEFGKILFGKSINFAMYIFGVTSMINAFAGMTYFASVLDHQITFTADGLTLVILETVFNVILSILFVFLAYRSQQKRNQP
jgi:hypothetical protein